MNRVSARAAPARRRAGPRTSSASAIGHTLGIQPPTCSTATAKNHRFSWDFCGRAPVLAGGSATWPTPTPRRATKSGQGQVLRLREVQRDRGPSRLYLTSVPLTRDRSPPNKIPANHTTKQSGRPDLNRGPHRPELWAKSASRCKKYLQIGRFRCRLTSSQILGFCGGFPGFRQRNRFAAK